MLFAELLSVSAHLCWFPLGPSHSRLHRATMKAPPQAHNNTPGAPAHLELWKRQGCWVRQVTMSLYHSHRSGSQCLFYCAGRGFWRQHMFWVMTFMVQGVLSSGAFHSSSSRTSGTCHRASRLPSSLSSKLCHITNHLSRPGFQGLVLVIYSGLTWTSCV